MKNACVLATLLLAMPVCAQEPPAQPSADEIQERKNPETLSLETPASEGVVGSIEFVGLRRIPSTTLRSKLASKTGEAVDAAKIARDVRTLEALGWFESVSVEVEQMPVLLARAIFTPRSGDVTDVSPLLQRTPLMKLIFTVEERPYLAKVDFRGGQVLTRERINETLAAKGLEPKLAAPCNRTNLWHAARALEGALAEMGHPLAKVRVRLKEVPTAAVRATFEIQEGPRVEIEKVQFAGNEAFVDGRLRKQMKEIAPQTLLAGLRGKTIYTPERLEKDLERIRQFYRNHGYAEAQTGEARVEFVDVRARRWWPWPGRTTKKAIHATIPVREGVEYQLERADIEGASGAAQEKTEALMATLKPPAIYSEEKILHVKDELAQAETSARARHRGLKAEVEATSQINREAQTIRVQFRVREAQPIVVRRIEFTGHKRFGDSYYRRRILLREGDEWDAQKLDRGLEQLARGGFVRPAKQEDVKVKLDEAARTADVTIRVEEIGRQKISLTGGGIGWGSSLGIAYNVFNLLGGEEMLTARIEGGPESLQILVGLAKDSVFGTRASLGINAFRNVVQPRLLGRGLFKSRSRGVTAAWNFPLTPRDTLGVNYELSKNTTSVPLEVPLLLPGLELRDVQSYSTRSGLEVNWARNTAGRQVSVSAGMAGGWLGGSEQSVRTSWTAAQFHADPLSHGRNTWALRGHVSGASSFGGATLPFTARSFAGEEFLRGFRRGELGPRVVTQTVGADGATVYGTEAAGANTLVAVNGEYRVPVESHTEFAAFFDAGTSWLVPHWLGGSRPEILQGTNGITRSSAGIELRVRVPVIEMVRVHYAVNPWRLAQAILLPDGTKFRPTDRRAVLGWAIGALF